MPNQMMIVQYKNGDIHAYNPTDPALTALWKNLDQIQSVVYADLKSEAAPDAPMNDFFFAIDESVPLPLFMKGLRIMANKSQRYIANEIGVPQTTISKWEQKSTDIRYMPTKEDTSLFLMCVTDEWIHDRILEIYF